MIDGQIDYVIIDNEPAKLLVEQNANDIKMIDIALTTEQYAYGVDKGQPALLASVNTLLATLKTSGALAAIFAKYDNLTYDDEGNVTGGDEAIVGIESAVKDASKADKQLVVATNAAFAPYEYKKGDKFVGIDMEIAKLIADTLGLELVIEDMDFDAVVTSVGKNAVDIAMAGLSVTATRKQSVNFSDAYYEWNEKWRNGAIFKLFKHRKESESGKRVGFRVRFARAYESSVLCRIVSIISEKIIHSHLRIWGMGAFTLAFMMIFAAMVKYYFSAQILTENLLISFAISANISDNSKHSSFVRVCLNQLSQHSSTQNPSSSS
jgi:hypothetical protein